MNESKGTLHIAGALCLAYSGTRTRDEFVRYAVRTFDMDEFTAEVFWETLDAVVDMGVEPNAGHPHLWS